MIKSYTLEYNGNFYRFDIDIVHPEGRKTQAMSEDKLRDAMLRTLAVGKATPDNLDSLNAGSSWAFVACVA